MKIIPIQYNILNENRHWNAINGRIETTKRPMSLMTAIETKQDKTEKILINCGINLSMS